MSASFHLAPAGPRRLTSARRSAFTLVELLVAMTILLIMVLLMVGLTNQTNRIWRGARARINAFQAGRNAFERITVNLNQATLNTYLDYYDQYGNSRADLLRKAGTNNFATATNGFIPRTYDRAADLQFVCGPSTQGTNPLIPPASTAIRPTHAVFFQCPLGHVDNPSASSGAGGTAAAPSFKNLASVLNAVGYYVEFSNENDPKFGKVPAFLGTQPASWRYRLMELNQPSQNLDLYSPTVKYNKNDGTPWFSLAVDSPPPGTSAPVFVVADNIVALVVRPKSGNADPSGNNPPQEIAPAYSYDTKGYRQVQNQYTKMSKNQLPPLVQVTMVAVDTDSATRLANRLNAKAPDLVASDAFTEVTKYDTDLAALEKSLQNYQLNYRIFVTDVSVPGAKWSQTN